MTRPSRATPSPQQDKHELCPRRRRVGGGRRGRDPRRTKEGNKGRRNSAKRSPETLSEGERHDRMPRFLYSPFSRWAGPRAGPSQVTVTSLASIVSLFAHVSRRLMAVTCLVIDGERGTPNLAQSEGRYPIQKTNNTSLF